MAIDMFIISSCSPDTLVSVLCLYLTLSCIPSPRAFLQSFSPASPRPPSTPPYCIMFPPLFVCLLEHRGKALGRRAFHLFWSGGHVNRGAPAGPTRPADTPRPPNPVILPISGGFHKEGVLRVAHASRHRHARARPGVMHDSRRSCGAKRIPWHDAHERGLLGVFSFNLYSCGEG